MKKIDLIFVVLLTSLFVGLTALVIFCPQISGYEHKIIMNIQGLISFMPNSIPIFLSEYGYLHNVWILFAVISLFLMVKKDYGTILCFGTMTYSVYYVSEFIKNVIARPRPPLDLQILDFTNPSFPSGHSLINACFYTFLIYLTLKYIKNKIIKYGLITLCVLWVLIMGFSRIWLGVHHPTDVFAGYIFGILYSFLFIILNKKIDLNRFSSINSNKN